MIGLAVIAGVALYIGIFWLIVRALKQTWAKALAVLVALAIPLWDLPLGYVAYEQLCNHEGGLRISTYVSPQESAYFDSAPSYSANEIIDRGLKMVEISRIGKSDIARHERGASGLLHTQIVTVPKSKVRVSYIRNQRMSWNISREDRIVRAQADDKVLARYSEFTWQGGWLQTTFRPFLGSGLRCTSGPNDPILTLLIHGGAPTS